MPQKPSPASNLQRRIDYRTLAGTELGDWDLLCLDAEFDRLPLPSEAVWSWSEKAELIAVALVPLLAGDSLYAARVLDGDLLEKCTSFVREQVIPHVAAVPPDITFRDSAELVAATRQYLAQRRRMTGKPPLLAVDWLGDAYLIEAVQGADFEWLLLEGVASVEELLGPRFPVAWVRHNAVHDAWALRDGLKEALTKG